MPGTKSKIPGPQSGNCLTFCCPSEVQLQLKSLAKKKDLSLSQILRRAVALYLTQEGK